MIQLDEPGSLPDRISFGDENVIDTP